MMKMEGKENEEGERRMAGCLKEEMIRRKSTMMIALVFEGRR